MFLLNNPIEVNNHKAIGWSLYKYTKKLKKNKMSLHSFPKRGCDGSQLPRVSKKRSVFLQKEKSNGGIGIFISQGFGFGNL